MDSPLKQWTIVDESTLREVCDILHDARFDLPSLSFDEESGILRATFERGYFEDDSLITHRRRLLLFFEHRFPLATSELTLGGVERIHIRDRSKIERYSFNKVQAAGDGFRFVFCEGLSIDIHFRGKPQGSLIDERILARHGALWTWYPWRKRLKQPHTS